MPSLFRAPNCTYCMTFKEWLSVNEGGWISKGKAQQSLFKPGPGDIKPKPHDIKKCGIGGGPGPGGDCASGGGGAAAPTAAPAAPMK